MSSKKKLQSRMERTSSIIPEVENVFSLIAKEQTEELISYILNE